MSREQGLPENLKVVVTAEQLEHRIAELGRQITDDYAGKQLFIIGVLENAFIFMADLIRHITLPTVCQFVLSNTRDIEQGLAPAREIFFFPEAGVKGQHVLLVEGLVQSGLTTDFLVNTLTAHGRSEEHT